MEQWQEAKQSNEPLLTTDDLVMMIGELSVRQREADKRLQLFNRQVVQQQANAESQWQSKMAQVVKDKDQSVQSLRDRIRDLEREVHEIALERDMLKDRTKKKRK